MNKAQQVKEHFKRNKVTYMTGGICLVVGAAGTYFLCKGENNAEVVQKIVQLGFRTGDANNVVIELVERSTRSKPVHLVGTNLYFSSLSEAAREMGYPLATLSKHINGHIPNVHGDVFELLEPAT